MLAAAVRVVLITLTLLLAKQTLVAAVVVVVPMWIPEKASPVQAAVPASL